MLRRPHKDRVVTQRRPVLEENDSFRVAEREHHHQRLDERRSQVEVKGNDE